MFSAGVAFRVWAPHASSASLIPYTANGRWTATIMTKEANGTFYTNIGNAMPGDSYLYLLHTTSGMLSLSTPCHGAENATQI